MLKMENAEEVMQILDRFTRLKQKEIPKELDDYLHYVAKTGDTVFKWTSLKYLFREKLLNVIKQFHESSSRVDEIPQYPNVDPFNYESMKSALLERLELFSAAPFTIQRLCELLIEPRKQYSRIDKFMRALEKNILVVSTVEPGQKRTESENGDSLDSAVNGDASMDVNVDTDMEKDLPTAHATGAEVRNGNGTVAAADEQSVRAEKAAEKSPAKDANSNAVRSGDDDVLPNPKKAKLDLTKDQEEKPNEAAMEVQIASEATKDKEETKAVEVKPTEKDVKTAEADSNAGEAEPAKEVKENGKPDNKDVVDKAIFEQEKVKAAEVHKEEKAEIAAEPATKMEVDAEENSAVVDSTEKEVKAETAKTAPKDEEKAPIEDEKIVEKQDIEKDEKKVASTIEEEPKAAEKTKELEKVAEISEADPKEVKEMKAKAKEAKVKEAQVEIKETKVEIKEAQTETKEAAAKETESEASAAKHEAKEEKPEAEATKPEPQEAKAAAEDSKTEAKEIETEAKEAEAVVEAEKPAPAEEEKKAVEDSEEAVVVDSTSETKSVVKEHEAEPKAAEDAPPIAEEKAEAEQVKVDSSTETISSSSSSTESAVEKKTEVAEKIDAKADDAVTPVVSTAPETTQEEKPPVEEQPATPIEADASPPVVASIEVDTPLITDAPAAAEVIAAKAEIPTPTLALNDQPMEETPGEAESTTSEEVVMAEPGVGTTEMATDAIESAKEEPAGMEVDDTSQEAMDQ